MGLTRRSFLTGAVPIVAGVVVAIEETTRRIFLPPRGGWAWRDVSEPIVNHSIGDMKVNIALPRGVLAIWNGERWEEYCLKYPRCHDANHKIPSQQKIDLIEPVPSLYHAGEFVKLGYTA